MEPSPQNKTGVLLMNLGTPDAPRTGPVRKYLREFLGDPRVIDIPAVPRALLLNLAILPTRPQKSAALYRKVWTDEGSPLLLHSQKLQAEVARELGENYCVELGMRYGKPDLASALERLRAQGINQICLAPLYPQYSASSTGSAVARALELLSESWDVPAVTTLKPFYDDPRYLDAVCAVSKPALEPFQPDHVLFSFHGLPERQVHKSDPSGKTCLAQEDCCQQINEANKNCYRAQCFATARALCQRLDLTPENYSVAFQSRLGRTPWISPYADVLLDELAEQGVKKVAVLCPAFVADCLETLEEIAIRAGEQWQAKGGEELRLIPSLNSDPSWVKALASMLRTTISPTP
jgi:ferrochelatase